MLAQGTEPKRFFHFSTYHTLPGETKVFPQFSCFGIVRLIANFFHQRVPHSSFRKFLTKWMLKISEGPLFQFFGIVRLLSKIVFFINGSLIHQYFDIVNVL